MFIRAVRYVKRTHPGKPTKWTKRKYWGRFNIQRQDNWVFGDKKTGNHIVKFSWTKIKRHPLVKKTSSPDDRSLKDYWEQRNKKITTSEADKLNNKRKRIASKQQYKCTVCGQSLFNNESLHLHILFQGTKVEKTTSII